MNHFSGKLGIIGLSPIEEARNYVRDAASRSVCPWHNTEGITSCSFMLMSALHISVVLMTPRPPVQSPHEAL